MNHRISYRNLPQHMRKAHYFDIEDVHDSCIHEQRATDVFNKCIMHLIQTFEKDRLLLNQTLS